MLSPSASPVPLKLSVDVQAVLPRELHGRELSPLAATQPQQARSPRKRHHTATSLHELRDILKFTALPENLTVQRLKTLYASCKRAQLLPRLRSSEFSVLISILGTLSISNPSNPATSSPTLSSNPSQPNIFLHRPALSMDPSSFTFQLNFAREVAADKRQYHELSDSDHYWLMLLKIARLRRDVDNVATRSAKDDARALDRIRMHYRQIRRHFRHADAHIPFLRVLIGTGKAPEAARWWCSYMLDFERASRSVFNVLWELVLEHGASLALSDKQAVLDVFRRRMDGIQRMGSSTPGPAVFSMAQGRVSVDEVIDVRHLVDTLDRLLRGLPRDEEENDAMGELWEWARAQAVQASEEASREDGVEGWSVLACLALSSSRRVIAPSIAEISGSGRYLDIQIVCMLSALDRSFGFARVRRGSILEDKQPAPLPITDLRGVVRRLWVMWSSSRTAVDRPRMVQRAVLAAFLRLSAVLEDGELMKRCGRYLEAHGLWDADTVRSARQIIGLGSDWWIAVVALLPSESVPQKISEMARLVGGRRDRRPLEAMAVRAVSSAKDWDPLVAYRIWLSARAARIKVPDEVVSTLGLALAPNYPHEAALVMKEGQISDEDAEAVLGRILRRVSSSRVTRLPKELSRLILTAMIHTWSNRFPPRELPIQLRGCVEYFLLMMPASGYSQSAVAFIQIIHYRDPSYFRTPFLRKMILRLMHHTQWKRAIWLANYVGLMNPEHARHWHEFVFRAVLLRREYGAPARLALRILPQMQDITPGSPRHILQTYATLPPRVASLHLTRPSGVGTRERPHTRVALNALVRAGRLRAAHLHLRSRSPSLPMQQRSVLGNIVLHGHVLDRRTRNRQHFQHVLRMLDSLVANEGAIPDRVTINILVKATLLWPRLADSVKLRMLFDQLVVSGYRSPSAPESRPFGTNPSGKQGTIPLPPSVSGPISFARHLRPMYKMFIRAFRSRGDREATRMVVSMLKEAKREAEEAHERRERARLRGRMRKARVLAKIQSE
ncbi:hypothetical protein PUNSTDRAFT_139286 [Punctularia strigosozonata HHB-11173 SS5]|uniref:Uncharacterized protein n=1 Tax=Punctularia strigosozonata (strain HHB-11173) TaxID=741275 RepID=R7S072_PUNST|nr:uncharacterized protein PUNSTDRAFT_139286 [Punctularia strigosozonata HHB-11173 SS5]EIN03760.1 hypothetical protein PUNSTDRAFT_139286 [Punctularia strigosozonata HHB-11173 SS5]